MKKDSTKTQKAKQYRMPGKLWRFLKKHLPKPPNKKGPGRPPVNNRNVLDGIWHVVWIAWKLILLYAFLTPKEIILTPFLQV